MPPAPVVPKKFPDESMISPESAYCPSVSCPKLCSTVSWNGGCAAQGVVTKTIAARIASAARTPTEDLLFDITSPLLVSGEIASAFPLRRTWDDRQNKSISTLDAPAFTDSYQANLDELGLRNKTT